MNEINNILFDLMDIEICNKYTQRWVNLVREKARFEAELADAFGENEGEIIADVAKERKFPNPIENYVLEHIAYGNIGLAMRLWSEERAYCEAQFALSIFDWNSIEVSIDDDDFLEI